MGEAAADFSRLYPVKFADDARCNTSDEVLLAQIAENVRRGYAQLMPHQANDKTALLVCGGPSLAETERELVDEVWSGHKIVAVNGAYQWCIDRNLKPSAVVMMDARAFNARFVETPVAGCKYLLASQCHPSTFDVCRDRDVLLWHAIGTGSKEELAMLDEYYFEDHKSWEDRSRASPHRYHPVTHGTSIGIRAITLLRMLGFQRIDIFGLDSCWLGDRHHGYPQPENDADGARTVWLRPHGRDDMAQSFTCAPWHVKQAEDFMTLVRDRGNNFQLSVRGPGLIAGIIRTGAEIEEGK